MNSDHSYWANIGEYNITTEREAFLDLHYDRYTFYRYHDKARHERDMVHRYFVGRAYASGLPSENHNSKFK